MFTAPFKRWFTRPAVGEAAGKVRDVVPPARPAHRARRPSEQGRGVEVQIGQTPYEMVIRLKGEATVNATGALLNGLLVPSACRRALVTLDLSQLDSISTLAMGVLVAYCRGVIRRGGRVRLAKDLTPAAREAVARADLLGLFERTADTAPER
jgi:anti-anti-sigma regulatory factor